MKRCFPSTSVTGLGGVLFECTQRQVAAVQPVNFTLAVTGSVSSVDVQEVTAAPVETDSFQEASKIDEPTSIEMLGNIFAKPGLPQESKWLLFQLDPPHEEKVRPIIRSHAMQAP